MTDMKRIDRRKWGGRLVPSRLAFSAIVGMGTLHGAAVSAWAQQPGRVPNEAGELMQWVFGIVLMIVIVAPVLVNPKRSHRG